MSTGRAAFLHEAPRELMVTVVSGNRYAQPKGPQYSLATFLRSGLGRPDVGVSQFADALGSLVAEFAGPGPKFLARFVYVFLLHSSWRKQDGQQRTGDHAGDADQPRIAPELFSQLTGAVHHLARTIGAIGVLARAIDSGGARLANRNYGAARRTGGLSNPPFVSTDIAAMKWPTVRPEYLPSLPGFILGTTTTAKVTSN